MPSVPTNGSGGNGSGNGANTLIDCKIDESPAVPGARYPDTTTIGALLTSITFAASALSAAPSSPSASSTT